MKVLFAVSNDEISDSIVKRYQKNYKEIISYKNVYYFNAILKELQKDKNYDRIVISEDLEAFTNTQYSQIDKFIFDKLDSISDEASNLKGDDIPIILICSDRREKSEEMLVKLFGIGIYNALIGNDRSVDMVCQLLNKPRLKKEAKAYYKIDSEDVSYQTENENDVSEVEIQNILAHYKRLGRDEKRYVESFDNIASQYNDVQLRIISKFLPLNVRAVLEEKSPKYQEIISFNNRVSDSLRAQEQKKKDDNGPSEKLLDTGNREKILSKPVVIPSSVNMNSTKKMAKIKNEVKPITNMQEKKLTDVKKIGPMFEDDTFDELFDEKIEQVMEKAEPVVEKVEEVVEEPKRRRGRPRKNPLPEQTEATAPKRGRGRPRKNPVIEDQENIVLPGLDENDEPEEDTILPGFKDETDDKKEETVLPGFENIDESYNNVYRPKENSLQNTSTIYENVDISNLLTSDKKVACFIGTSKNGTSFIVNNLADITSKMGIDTAILDTTTNRNSYYIYTQNDEALRKIAMNSVQNLIQGNANGIQKVSTC